LIRLSIPRLLLALLLGLLLPAHALAADMPDAHKSSFHAFYRASFPDDHAAQPVFSATGAHVDAAPRRGLRQLCRMTRTRFALDQQWSVLPQKSDFVWLQQGACTPSASAATLLVRMPDTELILILDQHRKALARARLLMAGNSACAGARSYKYALVSVGVGSRGSEAEEMVELGFASDHRTLASVWIRRSGAEYDAWNVACRPG
jgi:hypothetical protein